MFPLKIIKTNPSDPHFRSLIKQLDQDLQRRYGVLFIGL